MQLAVVGVEPMVCGKSPSVSGSDEKHPLAVRLLSNLDAPMMCNWHRVPPVKSSCFIQARQGDRDEGDLFELVFWPGYIVV